MSLKTIGWIPQVIGRKLKASNTYPKKSFKVSRLKLMFASGPMFYAEFNFRLFLKLLFTPCDAIHSNDLDTLLACYLAAKIKGKHLVYDSHEFFTEVPELLNNPSARKIWLGIEKWIFPKLKHVVTVNNSIALEYQKRYDIKPKVVRNIANAPADTNKNPENTFNTDNPFTIIMQGAGINIDRGAEELLEAFTFLPKNIHLKIIGKGDVFPELKRLQKQLGLIDTVHIIDALPYNELMQHTAQAHIGATLDKATNPNYALSLPNKIFDYLRAGLPVISSAVVEVANIVHHHNCGVVLSEVNAKQIADTVLHLHNNPEVYNALKINAINAAKLYAWENEFEVFEEIYKGF